MCASVDLNLVVETDNENSVGHCVSSLAMEAQKAACETANLSPLTPSYSKMTVL